MSDKEIKDEPIVDLGGTLSKSEQFFVQYKKPLLTAAVALGLVVGGYILYQNFVVAPASEEARKDLWKAAEQFDRGNDTSAVKGVKKEFMGFEEIADEYSNTNEGNLAKYYLAVAYFKQKKFDQALEEIEAFDAKGEMLPHMKNTLIGDIYVEKNMNEEALKKYISAAKGANNVLISPICLKKAAILSEQLGKNEDAVKYYEEIISAYFNDPMKYGMEKQKTEKALAVVKAKVALKEGK